MSAKSPLIDQFIELRAERDRLRADLDAADRELAAAKPVLDAALATVEPYGCGTSSHRAQDRLRQAIRDFADTRTTP